MIDIQSISEVLTLKDNGIWFSDELANISYPSDGNEACFMVEDNSFWFKHRNNCIISIIKSFPPKKDQTIFDVGGGNGFVSNGIAEAGFDVALIEPGIQGVLNAKKRGVKNVICATTETAKIRQHSLPAIGLFDVIEHIEDEVIFLRSIKELLSKDGYLYATVPAYSLLWSDEDTNAGHFKRYTVKSISQVLESSGFKVVYSSYIFRFLPIPVFFFRTLPYKLGISKRDDSPKNISKDHTVKSGISEKIISKILNAEINNIQNKKSMTFGSSCLIVAKIP